MNSEEQEDFEVVQDSGTMASAPKKPSKPVTVANSQNHTFKPKTITPIIRDLKINDYCTAVYSTLHKSPLAVHEFLDKNIIEAKASRDKLDFQKHQVDDPKDEKFFVDYDYYGKTDAYKKLNYDRGHMAPASDFASSQQLMKSTFTYANTIPQVAHLNRGSWKNLESYARNLIRFELCDTVEVVSGPIYYSGLPKKDMPNVFQNFQVVLMDNGIVVPPKCYKIIKANKGTKSYLAAFVLTNWKIYDKEVTLKSTLVPLGDLEYMTGLRFDFGKYQDLQKLDKVGMSKTYGDLNLQFYTKLYKSATTITDMASHRAQGFIYKTVVKIEEISQEVRLKAAEKEISDTLNEVGWKQKSPRGRKKINSLLGIHKAATDLEVLNKSIEDQIINGIKNNLALAKKEKDKRYYNYIAAKIYGNKKEYHYPLETELKQIFPQVKEVDSKKEDPKNKKQKEDEDEDEDEDEVEGEALSEQEEKVLRFHAFLDSEGLQRYPLASDDEIQMLISQLDQVKIEEQ